MAAIRRRGDRINVQIRKKGYPFISKSFVSLTVAKKWAATTEADMERRLHVVIPDDTTVGHLLERNIREVLPSHKGQQAERYRLGNLKRHFGDIRLTDLTSKEVAKYRDTRLEEVSPASLKSELVILRRVLTLARKDWGGRPVPEPCRNDLPAKGRQSKNQTVRGRGKRKTSSKFKSEAPTDHYPCVGDCHA